MAYRFSGGLIGQTFRPLFWYLATIYLGHRILVWFNVPRPTWVRHYLDDFLCLPLLLTTTLFLMRVLYGSQVRLTAYHVGFVVIYVSLVFEFFLPHFLPRYTTDFWDIGLYLAGGWIFYRFLNR